jgi:hyperosmotically inducible periplasmic protein
MKTTLFYLICGIALAGCAQQTANSQATPPRDSTVATNDATANGNVAGNATLAADSTDASGAPATKPDNTGINARDGNSDAVTAGSQGQSQSDINVTAEIRRRVMNGNLSVHAQNVKIICLNGKVTLRGPVNSQAEKDTIGQMAIDVAGAENVDNELEINPNG